MNLYLSQSKASEHILGVIMSDGIYCRDLFLYTRSTILPAINEMDAAVALILDMTHAHWVSPGGLYGDLKTCVQVYDDSDIDVIVFVSREPSINMLIKSIYQLHANAQREYYTAHTVDEAYNLIKQSRNRHTQTS